MTRIIDLSLAIDEHAPEPFPVKITRTGHAEGSDNIGRRFIYKKTDALREKLRKLLLYWTGRRRIDARSFPDGMFLSHESVEASVHCGTHVDSAFHFGPVNGGAPARKIDELPLEWCYGNAVVLDMTHLAPSAEITTADVEAALDKAGHELKPGDIALIRTGADRHFGRPEYFFRFPGMGSGAVGYLLDRGVRVIGTDAPGLDRPGAAMVEDYYRTGDSKYLWPAHLLGRQREYCHVERLANLGSLPRPHGFVFACFPVKIKNTGAAWTRAVAIFEDAPTPAPP
ncbi:MAG TPA: cyclase family protein, partial [Nitrospirota bacterium]|nr:cyclase family protein [Nitrospirota bacterium]